jgi:signal transduction histidine kinase
MNLQLSDFDNISDADNSSTSKQLIKQIKPSLKDMYKKTLLLSGFSKLFDLNIREIDLNLFLENLIMEFMTHPKFEQIKLKNIESPFYVDIDENLFQIALRNLIENALKYSNAESEILIELQTYKTKYTILIKNQGSISDKIIEKIKAGSKSVSSSGSGVGFLISRKIIENFGGECEIESENDEVTVTIKLPDKIVLEKQ